MNDKPKRKLKRYITPYINSFIAGILFAIIGVICVIATLKEEQSLQ